MRASGGNEFLSPGRQSVMLIKAGTWQTMIDDEGPDLLETGKWQLPQQTDVGFCPSTVGSKSIEFFLKTNRNLMNHLERIVEQMGGHRDDLKKS
ncbi:hypothetical protein J6590_082527 [Homalodisca vitripennis]|nr:hypothetical protein J6590_082527 [Homalodisca vitripennis]